MFQLSLTDLNDAMTACRRETCYKPSSKNKTTLHHTRDPVTAILADSRSTDVVEEHPFKVLVSLMDSKWRLQLFILSLFHDKVKQVN